MIEVGLTFLRSRFSLLLALLLTLLCFYGVSSRAAWDSEWMLRWNHVDIGQVQIVLVGIGVVLLLALPFPKPILSILKQGKVVFIGVALIASFFSVSLLEPDQQNRLFVTPFSIWIIIVYIVGLSALLVWWIAEPASEANQSFSASHQRFVMLLLSGIVLVLGILYVASRADFIRLDLPDEPFNASIATNYAQNNDLSSQYIGSAYGSPDVVFPRYYWVMGIWLKLLGSTSLAAQRSFPVLVAFLTLVVFAFALWRLRSAYGLTPVYILTALVVLISLSTFVRTSHDLRMDILLALYSTLMLWGMLGFWHENTEAKSKYRHLALMGLALFLGMEAIPLAAIPISLATGITLLVWWLQQVNKRSSLIYVIVYTFACAVGIGAYYILQFLPDIADSWMRYRAFVQGYSGTTGVGSLRLPLDSLVQYIGRFNLVLSPVELPLIILSVISLWRMKITGERWMLVSLGLGFILLLLFSRLAYSYMVVFAPFAAYVVARAVYSWQRIPSSILLVGIAALIAVPIFDLTWSIQSRPNQTYLESLDSLTPQFPEGTTIVGEDAFWFNLHNRRTYIGINGLANYEWIKDVDILSALNALKVDALLCDSGTSECQTLVDTGYFGSPTQYQVGNSTYLIYWRKQV